MSDDGGENYLSKPEAIKLAGSVRKFNRIRHELFVMKAVKGDPDVYNAPKTYRESAVRTLVSQMSNKNPVDITPEEDDIVRRRMGLISMGRSPNTIDPDPLSGKATDNETVDSAGGTQNMDVGPAEPASGQPAAAEKSPTVEYLPSKALSSQSVPPSDDHQGPDIPAETDDSSTVTKGEPNELDATMKIPSANPVQKSDLCSDPGDAESSGDQPKSGTPDEDTGDAPVGPLQLPLF